MCPELSGQHQQQSQLLDDNGQRGKVRQRGAQAPRNTAAAMETQSLLYKVGQSSNKPVHMSDRMTILACCMFQNQCACRQTNSVCYAFNAAIESPTLIQQLGIFCHL